MAIELFSITKQTLVAVDTITMPVKKSTAAITTACKTVVMAAVGVYTDPLELVQILPSVVLAPGADSYAVPFKKGDIRQVFKKDGAAWIPVPFTAADFMIALDNVATTDLLVVPYVCYDSQNTNFTVKAVGTHVVPNVEITSRLGSVQFSVSSAGPFTPTLAVALPAVVYTKHTAPWSLDEAIELSYNVFEV